MLHINNGIIEVFQIRHLMAFFIVLLSLFYNILLLGLHKLQPTVCQLSFLVGENSGEESSVFE